MPKNWSFDPNGIIFYAKRNCARKVAFDMPANVGPTYGMYVGPTLYQCYMSNMSYVGTTLRKHVGPTMAQRANLRWANVVCQRWANGMANQNTPLAQRYHAIWAVAIIWYSLPNCWKISTTKKNARQKFWALVLVFTNKSFEYSNNL